ncbi:MAG: cytochrome c biogenesis protein ResB [Propioniciclava sp.]|uniref:cytochrome c biogenesis protein ResB n=1 Tax=Propioniciclava sp. TaxID=2038686 RepID=UPI0039E724F1
MSLDMQPQTPPADAPEPRPGHDQHDIGVAELLHRIYALFYNKRFGLFLILAMTLLTMLGVLFPQAPGGVAENPDYMATWLEDLRPRYGGWTSMLAVLGIFTMFGSIPFKAVTIALALSIIACTTHRTPTLYAQAMKPHVHVRPTFFDHARVNASALLEADAGTAAAAVKSALLRARYRVIADADGVPRYADKNRFAPGGTLIAHTAFVVILIGVFVTSTFGFRYDDLTVPVGKRVEVGRGTNLAVEAVAFSDSYNPDGSPSDYVSELALYSEGQLVAQQTVRVNAPLRWNGWSLNQAFFGIAADLSVRDAAGAAVLDNAIALQYQTSDKRYSYGKTELADGTQIYLMTPASGQVAADIPAGKARVEVYPPGAETPSFAALLAPGEPVTGGGFELTFERERQFTGLMLSRDPGAVWVWVGSALLAIGTCWTMFLRHHRLWIRLEPAGSGTRVTLASPDRHDVTFERSVHALVASLPHTASAPAKKR